MILFVFEGKNPETSIYRAIERICNLQGNTIVCSFGNNIYELFKKMKSLDDFGDIVNVVKEYSPNERNKLEGLSSSSFSEIYLFFDYDFHHNSGLTLPELNEQLEEMLEYFVEETDNGKLYINYPMSDSIRHLKSLPDNDYLRYTISRDDCKRYKEYVAAFSGYKNWDFISFRNSRPENIIAQNWEMLKKMNVEKANYIVSGNACIPKKKADIDQHAIFEAQVRKYVNPDERVAILSSFPIFLYDYLR